MSLNLRGPITSLPPVIPEICEAFDISSGAAGMLTSIPVFCFGFLSPFIGGYEKISLESSVFATLGGVLLGTVIRSSGGFYATLAGTCIIGMALNLGNIAGLLVIGRDFSRHTGTITGFYVCGMSLGSMGTTGLTELVSHWVGWRLALALPVIPALIGISLWALVRFSGKKKCHGRERVVKSGGV